MDNLSHSLVGLAVGELVHRSFQPDPDPARQSTRRRMLLVAGAAASNFPDLDLVLTPLLPAPLGYLLHHRGHTHTLLYVLPQALLLLALMWILWPGMRALLRHSAPARAALALTMGAGFLLHMALDYLNSYGVHPFHPLDSRWRFGDAVYILEPVFWVVCAAPLAMMVRRWALRVAYLGLLAGALAYFSDKGYLHWASLAALLVLGAMLAAWQWRAGTRSRQALLGALAVGAAFAALQAAASHHGRELVAGHLARIDPASAVVDIAMTAYPANPLCWSFVSIEKNEAGGAYRLRRGMLSLAPQVLEIDRCPPAFLARSGHALREPVSGTHVDLLWESEASLAALRRRVETDCHFSAWMRFARAPAMNDKAASDARFGADENGNFTALPNDRFDGQPCPAGVPAWGMPRLDLLSPPPK